MANGSKLLIEDLILDGGTQPRSQVSDEAIAEYTEWLTENPERDMPPISVTKSGDLLWPWDGFHRIYSYKNAGRLSIPADVTAGTLRDAQLKSHGANWGHGVRRSHADKAKAVMGMLEDKEWVTWSDRRIADHVRVSARLVAKMRTALYPPETESTADNRSSSTETTAKQPTKRQGKDGKARKLPEPRTPRTADPVRNAAQQRVDRQAGASPAAAALGGIAGTTAAILSLDQHDESDVTPHRCPACGHRWEGMNEPPMLAKEALPDFPAGLDVPEFIEAWTDWVNYRRERKLPKYTSKGFSLQMKTLLAMGAEKAVAAIENSIKQNYNGIFPADGKGKSNGKASERTRHRFDPAVHGAE